MSALMTKTSLSVLAGVAGTLFISYCVYFDRKRRSDPDFKKKLRESKLLKLVRYLNQLLKFGFNANI